MYKLKIIKLLKNMIIKYKNITKPIKYKSLSQ